MATAQSAVPDASLSPGSFAGRGSTLALQSVVRIVCASQNRVGTGFFHKGGNLITAEHVVKDCAELTIGSDVVETQKATVLAVDADLDLALLKPEKPFTGRSLPLSSRDSLNLGTQVSTWGFPLGYAGSSPMLSVGYLAGADGYKAPSGRGIRRWVVNAAFNGGNSGGPLIMPETAEVIGVVTSKASPLSDLTQSILKALETQNQGVPYTLTAPDGTKTQMSESQVIGIVLNELRNQVQLVIGHATVTGAMKEFLTANKVEP